MTPGKTPWKHDHEVQTSSSGVILELYQLIYQLIYQSVIFSGTNVSVQLLFLCSIGNLSLSTFFPLPVFFCQTAASLNQQRSVWKWSIFLVFQGVSLMRISTLSRRTSVCKAFVVPVPELCQLPHQIRRVCGNVSCFCVWTLCVSLFIQSSHKPFTLNLNVQELRSWIVQL